MACSSTPGDIALCSGDGAATIQQLSDYWCSYDCPAAYTARLFKRNDGSLGYNAARLPEVQADVQRLFGKYFTSYQITSDPKSPAYDPFQEKLLSLCTDPRLPGVCDGALTSYCNVPRDRLNGNPALAAFCGCYVPPDPIYVPYTGATGPCSPPLPPPSSFNPCDPLCHRATTVQRACPATGVVMTCEENVCVIDDVSINLQKSAVGSVTFANVCPGCSTGAGCACIISSVNIEETMTDLGVGTQFEQLCGPGSVCIRLGPDGTKVVDPKCTTFDPGRAPKPARGGGHAVIWVLIVFAVIAIVFAIMVAAARGV